MAAPFWTFEHTVECRAPFDFAWAFWTDVDNWRLDSDVESVEIDGPFAAGARGVTKTKSSGLIEWRIAEAEVGHAVLDCPLPGAVGRFDWTFEDEGEQTRMTQRVTLDGERAPEYAGSAGEAFAAGIPAGMRKLCQAIEQAACGQN